MRTGTGILVAASFLLALPACSDDDNGTTDVASADLYVGPEQGAGNEGSPPPGDQGPPVLDKGPPTEAGTADTGVKDQGPQPDWGANPPNSGTICNVPANVCPHSQDECIIVSGGNQQKGMCLIKCTTKGADCPTKDPATQKSICFLDFSGTPAATYCAYMCLYSGKTYSCPTGSTCQSIGTNTSVCVQQ